MGTINTNHFKSYSLWHANKLVIRADGRRFVQKEELFGRHGDSWVGRIRIIWVDGNIWILPKKSLMRIFYATTSDEDWILTWMMNHLEIWNLPANCETLPKAKAASKCERDFSIYSISR